MGILNLQVGASSDDARQTTTTVSLTGANPNLAGPGTWLGFRWPGVTVPNAATVSSAIISFYVTSTSNDTPNGAPVAMQDADNAATFTTTPSDISARALTSPVAWSGANIGAGWKTVDVTAAVQAVVNRAGWASGNALVAVINGATGTDLTITAWDGTPANAAKLDITYVDAGQTAWARGRQIPGMRKAHGAQGW